MAAPAASNKEAVPVTLVDTLGAAQASSLAETNLAESATGAAAQITATLAAAAGKTTHISGFVVDGLGATGASVVEVVVSGLLGGSLRRKVNVPAGATVAIAAVAMTFDRPIPASAVNTAIVVTVPSFGAGNTSSTVSAWGFNR